MLGGFVFIALCLLAGEAVSLALGLPVPGSVIGMVLMTAALQGRWLRLETVKPAADVLLRNMSLLFVPPGVGLMVYANQIADAWLPIAAATVASTFVVLAVTGWIMQWASK